MVARTASQFAGMLKRNPFPNAVATNLYFTLFAKTPEKQLLKEFLSTDFSPDQVRFVKDTLYTLYATKHKDSRFNNNYFERHLGVLATTRNGNTVPGFSRLPMRHRLNLYTGSNSNKIRLMIQPTTLFD